MFKPSNLLPLFAIASVAVSGSALADAKDDAMRHLASKSGCFICHGIEPDSKGPDGMKPVGPPFKSVAQRYKNDKAAAKRLTNEVLVGTSPYSRHWKDEVSGVAMPPSCSSRARRRCAGFNS